MSGHSKFSTIKHKKGAKDAKRAKVFTKITREITVAARSGQPDIDFNPRLRNAVISARKAGVPRERIETAIKKGSGEIQGENFEEIHYEGYGPGGVALIVEALTDNRNRTASEVRSAFTKHAGNLGETGSVGFMFENMGIIEYEAKIASNDAVFEAAVEVGADNVISDEEMHIIYTNIDDLTNIRNLLTAKYGDPETARIGWRAKIHSEITSVEQLETVMELIEMLEDLDDVQFVSANYIVPDEIKNILCQEL